MKNEMVTFWSRSKDSDCRYLSNFETVPGGIPIPDDFLISQVRGRTFPSVENAFQACKYAFSELETCKNVFSELEVCSSKEAKSAGSKTGMKKRNTVLDVHAWNTVSVKCMTDLLGVRYKTDSKFKAIIESTKSEGKLFYHIETRGGYIWGGCMKNGQWVGQNRLGQILNQL